MCVYKKVEEVGKEKFMPGNMQVLRVDLGKKHKNQKTKE